MVINEINIINFGNISNKKIEFTNGFNLILGENEKGKSTILNFIRFVFYGFSGRKSELKKYEPLSGEKINGSLTVTQGKNVYEISRNLNLTKSKQVSCVNKTTGEVMDKDFCDNLGQNLLNKNDASFINTMFIGQGASRILGDKEEILTKLSNITQSGDEDISYNKILSNVDDEILNLTSPRRKDSVIVNLENEIATLNTRLFEAKTREQNKLLKQNEIKNIENEISKKEEELSEYKKQIEISKALTLKKREKDENNNIIRLKTDIDNAKDELSKIEINKRFLQIDEDEEYEFLNENTDGFDERKEKLKKTNVIFLILMVFCSVATVALGVVSIFALRYVLLSLAVIFAIGFTFSLIKYIKTNKEISLIEKETKDINLKKEAFLNKYGVQNRDEYISEKKRNENALKEKEILTEKIRLQTENLEISTGLMEKAKDDILTNYQNLDTIKVSDWEKYKNADEINTKISITENEINRLLQNKMRLEVELEAKDENDVISVMQKLETKKEDLKKANEKLNVLETFKKYLMLSFDELKSDFAPKLTSEAEKIFSMLTNEKHSDILINEDFDAKIKLASSYADSSYLSGATLDQLYLSVRLGIINTLGENNYPVIFDDAFNYYDDKRLLGVLEFLKEYSKTNQIIVASCQMREANILGNSVNTIKL